MVVIFLTSILSGCASKVEQARRKQESAAAAEAQCRSSFQCEPEEQNSVGCREGFKPACETDKAVNKARREFCQQQQDCIDLARRQ